MATNRDLLKEAIADAKSVKEVAIANAKLALEEAFTPFLKDQLSAKLQEMDKDEDDVKEEVEEVEEQEVAESNDEINLDELLAELEDSKDLSEEKDSDDDKDNIKEDEKTDAEEEGYEDGEKDEKEDIEGEEDEDIDLEDMSEDDLKGFIEDVIKDMVEAGEIEAGDEFVEDEVEVEDVEDIDVEDIGVEDDVDVDIEIDETMKASEENSDKVKEAKVELDEMSKKEKAEGDDRKKDDKIEAETEKMRFKEALDEINALKVELQEVNLLNAKLLYTNKIFKAKNLNESKKVKVLKAFDRAKSVEQAKTIFETLNEGITSSVTIPTINESIKRGAASKASGLEPKATKQPIIESNDVYNRMRTLAGLL